MSTTGNFAQNIYESNIAHSPSSESTPLQHFAYSHMPASQAAELQRYHESSMSGMPEPEPLSAYARWKIENDERFYATFPQARYAAHDYNTVSSAYWDGTGYYYNTDAHVATHPGLTRTSSVSPSSFASYEDVPTSQPLQHPHYNHNDYFSHESAQPSVPVSTAHDSYPRSSHEHPSSTRYDMTGLDSVYRPTDLPPTEVIHTNIVVPSQQPESCKVEPPLMDHLPPPDSPTPSTSSHIPTLHDTENKHNYYHQSHPYAQAVKTEPSALVPLDHYASHPPISRHPNPSYNYYPVHNPQPPPAGWPTVRAPSPRGIRLSPLPPSRRPHSKKPPLACIFCRGRKIACGPPDSGSSDRSCNQCQRRSIKCEYPAESRRGMRKKKVHAAHAAGPKVRLGKRSRTLQ